ncbi:MAG: dihydrolipoyl dehydrogenase [Thiomicrorhabdus sp.]|nr:dihydrolipoyl dehydrogenase [Thiomicrorhabdus sp.]
MRKVKYAILGAGTSGLTALGVVRKHTEDFVVINGGALGTTCARVGCMPSKVMIQSANLHYKKHHLAEFGIKGGESLEIDIVQVMQRVQRLRDRFTTGVKSGTTETLKPEQFIDGYAKFIGENLLEVNGQQIEAEKIIIATGSRPVMPQPWLELQDKVLTSDEIFELPKLPKRVAVIGLGVIGLELGQALSRLGVQVVGFEMQNTLGGLSSPCVIEKAVELFSKEFPIHLGAGAQLEKTQSGVMVRAGEVQYEVDMVLAALGRRPNIDGLQLEKAGVELDDKGLPKFDLNSMQIEDKPLFIAGDVNVFRPILHEAGYEGKIAVLNAISYPQITRYKRKTPMGIAFTEPNIGMFGESYRNVDMTKIEVVDFNLEKSNGRAIVMDEDMGVISLYGDKDSKRLIGGEVFMPHAEHLTHLLSWAVEQEMTVLELIKMPFYHPVLEEAVQSALNQLYKALYTEGERGIGDDLTVLQ